MSKINTKLNTDAIPAIVGVEPMKLFKDCYKVIENTRWPVYLTGPSGGGKSIIAMNIAKQYAEDYGVPAYYVQLSPEQTKTSLILGLRLVDGTLKVTNGVVADCMEQGGIIIIDEATHSMQELLLMFNSILDRTSVTSIGDKTITSDEKFRVIFCANDSRYAGNIKLPQSFAQRLVAFHCDYPSWKDEFKIIEQVAYDECMVELRVPQVVIKYITSLLRETRSGAFPLSVRNGAIATVLLQLAEKKPFVEDDDYFTGGQNIESIRRNIANRIFNQTVLSVDKLNGPEMAKFTRYITRVGIPKFKQIILQSFMYYLDIDMGFHDMSMIKETLEKKII